MQAPLEKRINQFVTVRVDKNKERSEKKEHIQIRNETENLRTASNFP